MLPGHREVRRAMLALLLAMAPVWAAGAPSDADVAAIEKAVDARRAELHVPGAALAVVVDDRVVLLKGLGLRDVERKLPVTPDTLFAIASCTKAFTAAAVLMAADDGKLALTDHPRKHLPVFRLRDPDADAKVTISDLLCHRTGLGRMDVAWYMGRVNAADVLRVAAEAKPTAKLGEKWQYQNAMYLAAGELAARAEGTTYPQLVQRRIFAPLGMRASGMRLGSLKGGRDFARGYVWDTAASRWNRLRPHEIACIAPAGAINSTARDMASWLRFMLGDGAFEGKRLLSQKSFADLTARHIEMWPGMSYGYGWMVGDWRGERVVEHEGNVDGYNTLVAYLPDRHLGLVILTNVFASPLPAAAMDLTFEKLTGKTAPPPPPTPTAVARPPAAPFKAPLTAEELRRKIIETDGGERTVRSHHTLVVRYAARFEEEGVTGLGVTYGKAPSYSADQFIFSAAGKVIGRARDYFDGRAGGLSATFGSGAKGEAEVADRTVEAAFYGALDWPRLLKAIEITGIQKVNGEDAYVVRMTPEHGSAFTDYYSTSTFLLLKHEGMNGQVTFSDYRRVGGQMIAFRRTRSGAGAPESLITVLDARFDVPLDDDLFLPPIQAPSWDAQAMMWR